MKWMQKNLLKGGRKRGRKRKQSEEGTEEQKIDIAINTNWPFIGPFMKFLRTQGL